MAKTKTISVTFRCPEDLHNKLSNFALDNNIVKDGKPIISEALIAALSLGLGSHTDVSQDVRQSNIDIQALIDDALSTRIKELREEFEEHEEIMVARSQKAFEVQIATFREEMNEAIATAKKPLLSVMREKVIAA